MDARLESLLLRARAEHECGPGATSAEIADAEASLGCSFTGELRELLRTCNGIRFWKTGDYRCRLLPLSEIKPVRLLLGDGEGPRGLIAIVEAEEAFVGIDLDPRSRSHARLIDCFHETFPYELCGVCDSLAELLGLILDSKGQEWLWPAARAYNVDFAE